MLSPAKINLYLAVTRRRDDGFHDLVSLVAPLAWGDELTAEAAPPGEYSLRCDHPGMPQGEDNLILRAARAFAAAAPGTAGAVFHLQKRIPMGAGLGGGSSNAAAALKLLQDQSGAPLTDVRLLEIAAALGSDCPLFLKPRPLVIRGRGERLEELPPGACSRIAGLRVLVFKPGFGIGTPWAYRELAAEAPASYVSAAEAEAHLAEWFAAPTLPLESILGNNLERPAFRKYPALPAAAERLRARFGLQTRMSGSGSALFALLPPHAGDGAGQVPPVPAAHVDAMRREITQIFGPTALCVETSLTLW